MTTNILVDWIDERLSEVLSAPRMWGSREAVELQVLLLHEIRVLGMRPTTERENPRRVVDLYINHLHRLFPALPSKPLFELVGSDAPEEQFVEALKRFGCELKNAIQEENPFQHNPLAIRLEFSDGRRPPASAVTGYYEEFRRAVRASAEVRSTGRHRGEIERATDFLLEDVRFCERNGSPAHALLLLDIPRGQQDYLGNGQTNSALGNLLQLGEWAETERPVNDLSFDDVEVMTRTAVQARRLLPSRGLSAAAIGGTMVGRSNPISFRAQQEQRLIDAIASGIEPEPFDQRGEIRAIDLDRGSIAISVQTTSAKRSRITCYLGPQLRELVSRVGVSARVEGKRYDAFGRQFVVASDVRLDDFSDDLEGLL